MKPVHIGCSGWNYAHWRGRVYPDDLSPSRWLERYVTLFDTVEVNATFYGFQSQETVARWVDVAPDGFVFAIKASRYLTHVKRLNDLPKPAQTARAARAPDRDTEDGTATLAVARELSPR